MHALSVIRDSRQGVPVSITRQGSTTAGIRRLSAYAFTRDVGGALLPILNIQDIIRDGHGIAILK